MIGDTSSWPCSYDKVGVLKPMLRPDHSGGGGDGGIQAFLSTLTLLRPCQ